MNDELNWQNITDNETVKKLLLERMQIEQKIKELDEKALINYEIEALKLIEQIMLQKLESQFTGKGEVKGFKFQQVYENKKGYAYKVHSQESEYFEAFLKKSTALCINFEKREYSENEFKEIYPKSKDFGVWAWTVGSLEDGVNKIIKFA